MDLKNRSIGNAYVDVEENFVIFLDKPVLALVRHPEEAEVRLSDMLASKGAYKGEAHPSWLVGKWHKFEYTDEVKLEEVVADCRATLKHWGIHSSFVIDNRPSEPI